jgi:hypothetical protein
VFDAGRRSGVGPRLLSGPRWGGLATGVTGRCLPIGPIAPEVAPGPVPSRTTAYEQHDDDKQNQDQRDDS